MTTGRGVQRRDMYGGRNYTALNSSDEGGTQFHLNLQVGALVDRSVDPCEIRPSEGLIACIATGKSGFTMQMTTKRLSDEPGGKLLPGYISQESCKITY